MTSIKEDWTQHVDKNHRKVYSENGDRIEGPAVRFTRDRIMYWWEIEYAPPGVKLSSDDAEFPDNQSKSLLDSMAVAQSHIKYR